MSSRSIVPLPDGNPAERVVVEHAQAVAQAQAVAHAQAAVEAATIAQQAKAAAIPSEFVAERPRHQQVSFEIAVELRLRLSTRGRIFCPSPGVKLGEVEVIPDVAVLLLPFHPRLNPKRILGAPDLVVEVLAEDRERDEIYRRALYERTGVRELWLADPLSNGCTILVMDGGRYVEQEQSRILEDVSCYDVGYWIARA